MNIKDFFKVQAIQAAPFLFWFLAVILSPLSTILAVFFLVLGFAYNIYLIYVYRKTKWKDYLFHSIIVRSSRIGERWFRFIVRQPPDEEVLDEDDVVRALEVLRNKAPEEMPEAMASLPERQQIAFQASLIQREKYDIIRSILIQLNIPRIYWIYYRGLIYDNEHGLYEGGVVFGTPVSLTQHGEYYPNEDMVGNYIYEFREQALECLELGTIRVYKKLPSKSPGVLARKLLRRRGPVHTVEGLSMRPNEPPPEFEVVEIPILLVKGSQYLDALAERGVFLIPPWTSQGEAVKRLTEIREKAHATYVLLENEALKVLAARSAALERAALQGYEFDLRNRGLQVYEVEQAPPPPRGRRRLFTALTIVGAAMIALILFYWVASGGVAL